MDYRELPQLIEKGLVINDLSRTLVFIHGSAVDEKLILLKAEISLRSTILSFLGGGLIGLGMGTPMAYRRKKKMYKVLENLVYEIERKNS